MIPFLAIYAKGGESMSPKQKDRTTTNLKILVFSIGTNLRKSFSIGMIFQIGISLCSKRGESSIFKINILKPSWTLRGGLYQGGVLFKSKEKHLKQGEKNFKSWKCFAKSYSFTFDYLQKDFEKNLQKNLQKQNMWCKRGPKC
jgi:hypothetical protein